jgi:hypothetical protein
MVLSRESCGQPLAATEDSDGHAAGRLARIAVIGVGSRALPDDDLKYDLLGQVRIAQGQQRLPVQAGAMTVIDASIPHFGRMTRGHA